jgi:hypothetical protein
VYSRGFFGKLAAAAAVPLVASTPPNSVVAGVQIGAQTNRFSDRDLDGAIRATLEIGIGECELWQGHVGPRAASGKDAELSRWHGVTPASYFHGIARRFRT